MRELTKQTKPTFFSSGRKDCLHVGTRLGTNLANLVSDAKIFGVIMRTKKVVLRRIEKPQTESWGALDFWYVPIVCEVMYQLLRVNKAHGVKASCAA